MRLHRIHLEEDAASSSTSASPAASTAPTRSIVDYNRGGMPLVEIVTEPDIHSAEQARDWLHPAARDAAPARRLAT